MDIGLDSGLSSLHYIIYVMFLGKNFYSHGTSIHPLQVYKRVPVGKFAGGNPAIMG